MFDSRSEDGQGLVEPSLASFRALFEQAPLAIQVCAPDGRTVRVNEAYRQLWGCDPAADANILEGTCIIHPNLGPLLGRAFGGESVYAPPVRYSAEQVPLLAQGYMRWVETHIYPVTGDAGAIEQVIVVFNDVTDRIQAEQLLRESELRFRSAFEHAAFGMALIGTDGRFLQVNASLCQMLGYTQSELMAMSFQDLTWEEDLAVGLDLFDDLLHGRRDYGWLEKRYVHKDGHPLWTLLSTAAVRDEQGALLYLVSQIQDISTTKQATETLELHVQERTRELTTLLRVSREIVSTLELEPLLSSILDQLKEIVSSDAVSVLAWSQDGDLHLLGYRGPMPVQEVPQTWDLAPISPLSDVLDRREPLIIPDVRDDTEPARAWRAMWASQIGRVPVNGTDDALACRAWMGVPMLIQNRIVGVISLEHHQAGHYTPYHANLALAFASQTAVAIDNARLYRRSQQLAVLEERQRIARELHDSVSQALYGIGLGARTARTLIDRDPAQAAEPLEYILSLAEAGLAEMRALIFELLPDALRQEGLVVALSRRAAALQARHNLQLKQDFCPEPDVPLESKEALYRVAQEALNNIAKHARAQQVTIRLVEHDGQLTLSVADDGVGFEPQADYPGHIGLRTMRQRIEQLGGQFEIHSAPGQGSRLHATLTIS